MSGPHGHEHGHDHEHGHGDEHRDEHGRGHTHDHGHGGHSTDDPAHPHNAPLSDVQLRVKALESLITEKGLVDPSALDELIDTYETKVGPRNGARVVPKAWVDPEFKRGSSPTRRRSSPSWATFFPDTHAAGLGRKPQHVYSVRFDARELWGQDGHPRDSVYVDLWDDYLNPT